MIRKHLLFFGRVQGVGFRYYSVNMALHLGLTGWVRNLSDGSVEMEVQGKEENIDRLIKYLNERRHILISDIKTKTLTPKEEDDFREIDTY